MAADYSQYGLAKHGAFLLNGGIHTPEANAYRIRWRKKDREARADRAKQMILNAKTRTNNAI